MLSTRVKLTAAFVAGLVAVTITLFLAVLAAGRRRTVDHVIGEVELLAAHPQCLDQLLARPEAGQLLALVPLNRDEDCGRE